MELQRAVSVWTTVVPTTSKRFQIESKARVTHLAHAPECNVGLPQPPRDEVLRAKHIHIDGHLQHTTAPGSHTPMLGLHARAVKRVL